MPQIRDFRSDILLGKSGSIFRLDKVEECSICIVLAKAIDKIKILQQLLPETEVEGYDRYQSMVTRMTALQKISPPEDQESDNTEGLKNLQKCCHMSKKALDKVIVGFKSEGMLYHLKQTIFAENRRYYDNFLLKQENLNLINTIQNLKDKINEVKKNSHETRTYLDKMTQFCLQQAETTTWAQSKTLKRNASVYQQARVDLNNYRLKEKEEMIAQQREQCNLYSAREDIISSEILNHLKDVTDSLQKKFEKWTARYSEEVDALDITLLQLRSKMEEQQEKYETMSKQHAARQELVDVLQVEGDERDRAQETRLAQSKAAVIIQQWWRKILLFRYVHKTAKNSLKKKKKNNETDKKKNNQTDKKKKK